MKPINLIPAARRDAKRRRKQRNACAIACCAFGALLGCAVGAARLMFAGDGGQPLGARLAATEAEIDRYQQQSTAARAELAAAKATIEANRTVAEQPDWSILLALLAKTTGDDVVLRSVLVAPPPPGTPAAAAPTPNKSGATPATPEVALELTGVGQTQLAVSQHVLRLEQTGLFSKVTLLDTNREAYVNSNVIGFRLQCQFGEPRQPVSAQLISPPPRGTALTTIDAGGTRP
jgi:hypothetical protein